MLRFRSSFLILLIVQMMKICRFPNVRMEWAAGLTPVGKGSSWCYRAASSGNFIQYSSSWSSKRALKPQGRPNASLIRAHSGD